jgi:NAD(P)-dependent dehydrogenase (short-subunit alcohol dehydrogenase family)
MIMNKDLAGSVAIITGSGSGLGAAIARALAAEGARCVLAGRRPEPLQAVAGEIAALGGDAWPRPTDVADEAQATALVAETAERFGRLDVLVNCAGLMRQASLVQTSTALWDEILNVNLRGAFLLCRAAWPHLQRSHGQIINVSSMAAVQGYLEEAAYCASKHGLNGLTEVLALEGKPSGIRALAVCPAATETPLWDQDAPRAVQAKMMKPAQVAELVRWLILAPRNLEFGPVIMRNFDDPWK